MTLHCYTLVHDWRCLSQSQYCLFIIWVMTSEVYHQWREETADGLVTVYCLGVGQRRLHCLPGAAHSHPVMSSGSAQWGPASWNIPRSITATNQYNANEDNSFKAYSLHQCNNTSISRYCTISEYTFQNVKEIV